MLRASGPLSAQPARGHSGRGTSATKAIPFTGAGPRQTAEARSVRCVWRTRVRARFGPSRFLAAPLAEVSRCLGMSPTMADGRDERTRLSVSSERTPTETE